MAELTVVSLHEIEDVVAGRYRIYALLGRGGTGSTYQAEDLKTHRWVALKVMSLKQLGNWDLLTRFEREAEALGKIDHPGVPDYIEHFQVETADDCRFYLVQEFAAGKSLDKWVADGWRATEAEVKRIGAEVLTTLAYLHELDPPMIHRDIKPQNIIRQPDGRIYLVDFGAVQSVCRDALHQRGTFVGTMGYMPPEQLRGKAVFASDLYGLGATLVYLLTHRNPDELPMERMRIAFRGRVKLSEGFTNWLEKMLEPMVKHRWVSADAALAGLPALPRVASSKMQALLPKIAERSVPHNIAHEPIVSDCKVHLKAEDRALAIYVGISGEERLQTIVAVCAVMACAQVLGVVGAIFGGTIFGVLLSLFFGWRIHHAIWKAIATSKMESRGYNWISLSPSHYSLGMYWPNRKVKLQTGLAMEVSHFDVRPQVSNDQSGKMFFGGLHTSETTSNQALFLVFTSGLALQVAGNLPSEEAVELAAKANQLLKEQRLKFPPFVPSQIVRLDS